MGYETGKDPSIALRVQQLYGVRETPTISGRPVQVQVLAPDRVQVELTGGEVVEAEKLLWAAGRTGNTTGLGLEHLGLEADVSDVLTAR